MNDIPLCVDLDGTLLDSDMLVESAFSYVKSTPLGVFKIPLWLMRGKAHLKAQLAANSDVDVTVLPYNAEVLSLIETARKEQRKIVLATATHKLQAEAIAEHLGCFDEVVCSDDNVNLSSHNKRDALVNKFGENGFDYAGNSSDDLVVWNSARKVIIVNAPRKISNRACRQNHDSVLIDTRESQPMVWLKALRFHQWLKNILLFVPLLASHQFGSVELIFQVLIGFFLFGICASSVYLLNDLVDLNDDRHHHSKRYRPFASGSLSVKSGLLVAPLLLVVAFTGAFLFLPTNFILVLSFYYALTLSYSFVLKRIMALDVLTLAALYTTRVIAGAAAANLHPTFWLLAFSMFIFLSLAFIKRYTELYTAKESGKTGKTRGRGYYPADLELISSLGTSSGYLAVLVLALYIQDTETLELYSTPEIMWLACPLMLFWITRTWLVAHRGKMDDDPIVFAAKDKISLFIGAIMMLVFFAAS